MVFKYTPKKFKELKSGIRGGQAVDHFLNKPCTAFVFKKLYFFVKKLNWSILKVIKKSILRRLF